MRSDAYGGPDTCGCHLRSDEGRRHHGPSARFAAVRQGARPQDCAITDLIQYRAAQENLVECVGERPLQTAQGEFTLKVFREKLADATHLAIVKGTPSREQETVVRVHEPLSVIDTLDASAAVHSWSIPKALARLQQAEAGVLVLLHRSESAADLRDRVLNAKPLNAPRWTCAPMASARRSCVRSVWARCGCWPNRAACHR